MLRERPFDSFTPKSDCGLARNRVYKEQRAKEQEPTPVASRLLLHSVSYGYNLE